MRPFLFRRSPTGCFSLPLPVLLFLLLFLPACGSQAEVPSRAALPTLVPTALPLAPTNTATLAPRPSATATATATASPSATTTATPMQTPAPTITPTPDPFAAYTVASLAARDYGGGTVTAHSPLLITSRFTRTLITYPSDGLTIYGFMNIPRGPGPFPVALVLHGYVPPENYNTVTYTARYADTLAEAGYLVVHPNYRNFPPSDQTEAFAQQGRERDFRVGYAVDVLNLMAIVREQAGHPGPLAVADGSQIYLFGHSMGGGITLRVLTVDAGVRAAVLYGSMSGDEYRNYQKILEWSNGEVGDDVLATPAEDLARISPIHHLERITAAVSIHHGSQDTIVPPEWSTELCALLRALGKVVECYTYLGQPHTFWGENDLLLQQRAADFFGRH